MSDKAESSGAADVRAAKASDLITYVRRNTTGVDIDPIETLRTIVRHIGATGHGSRWSLFGRIAGHGSGVSSAIVQGLGFDPDEVVGACTTCSGSGGCAACDGDGATLGDDDELVECPVCGGAPECEDCHGSGADVVRQAGGS